MQLPRPVVELINAFERLPGIGPKSATRLAIYLLATPNSYIEGLANSLLRAKSGVRLCQQCYCLSEQDICTICSDNKRDKGKLCVVEKAIDVITIENAGGFNGLYHVLGGAINPLEHIGPEDLKIYELIERVKDMVLTDGFSENLEIILALNPTMEGEATALYIKRKLENLKIESLKITRIGSGLPMGADLEFADLATVSRAMEGRKEV